MKFTDFLPDYELFQTVCQRGLSVVRPLAGRVGEDQYGWQFGTGWPPSYWAFGRLRTLVTLQIARTLAPNRFLEVAAGDGALAACLAAQGVETVANDLRCDLLRQSLTSYTTGSQVQVYGGNFFDLGTNQLGQFDLIAACEVIEHVAHPDELLQHLRQFLVPGGRILLTTPNGSFQRNKLPTYRQLQDVAELESRQFHPDADGHLFLLTPPELCDLARSAGLIVEKLILWGTPLLTGHFKLSRLASAHFTHCAYAAESLIQLLPWRAPLCFSMLALLRRE